MKRFARLFVVVIGIYSIIGCAAGLSVDRLSNTPIDSNDKDLILLTHSRYDPQILKALAKAGFTVKEQPATRTIQKRIDENTVEQYHEADARYGLRLMPGMIVDRCIAGNAVKYDEFTYEIVDYSTNKPILFVNKGGWTGYCFPSNGTLFEDLAKELANNWH